MSYGDERDKTLNPQYYRGSAFQPHAFALSECARCKVPVRPWTKVRRWRETYVIDPELFSRFHSAAARIAANNHPLNANSYKVNILLTVNISLIAREHGVSATQMFKTILRNIRNRFRGRKHRFVGFWRCEIDPGRLVGIHYHIAFHAPRGLRAELIEFLPHWVGDPIDERRSSTKFNRYRWRVNSVLRQWNLTRISNVPGLIAYLSKVPLDQDDTPIPRKGRLDASIREYCVFGVPG